MNEAREKTERIIAALHEPWKGKEKKPRTYREQSRKESLKVSKKRKPNKKMIVKGIKKQSQYLRRNLNHIEELSTKTPLQVLGTGLYKDRLVISELCRQHKEMFDEKKHTVPGRIASIGQPHVRPIVRGKANELTRHIENDKKRFGCYPESVHVDGIYRNRENRRYCKNHNIRISGPPLGRLPKDTKGYRNIVKSAKADDVARIPTRGVFGVGKRRYGMARIVTKMKETSETAISMTVLVMNWEKTLRDLLLSLFRFFQKAFFLAKKRCIRIKIVVCRVIQQALCIIFRKPEMAAVSIE